jgi:hypothetical protein
MLREAEALHKMLVGLLEQISPDPALYRVILGSDQTQDETGTAASRNGRLCGR